MCTDIKITIKTRIMGLMCFQDVAANLSNASKKVHMEFLATCSLQNTEVNKNPNSLQ